MNVLVEDIVDRLSQDDPNLNRLAVSRLPLWTVTAEEIQALVQALEFNTHVTHLDFWLPQEKDESERSDDFDLSAIAENTSEEDLLLTSSPALQPAALSPAYLETVFAHNASLESLQVGCSSSASDSTLQQDAWKFLIRGLQQNKSIMKLELDGGSRGDGSSVRLETAVCQHLADYVANANCLKELALSNIQAKTPEGLTIIAQGLAANESLESLEIIQMQVDDDDEDDVEEGWKDAWCQLLASLGQVPTLDKLRLIECDMPFDILGGSQALRSLCQSRTLRCLRWIESELSLSSLYALAKGMENSNLEVLDLRGNGLSAVHCQPLSKLLEGSNLRKLILEENVIGDDGLVALSAGLAKLRKVNLRSNLITGRGCKVFSETLSSTSILRSLDLSENAIADEGAEALANAMNNLLDLEVESCLIADDGIAALAKGISGSNSSLRSLSLSQNCINEAACQSLVKMLARNESLVSLDLSSCHISDSSVAVLADGLKKRDACSLQHLSVAFNAFGNEGALAIGECLPKCELERLEVQFNGFDDDGLTAIVKGLSENCLLTDLFVLNGSTYSKRSSKLVEDMSYWLSLNRAGRRAIVNESIPLSAWPHILARADRAIGPKALFYMLRSCPSLVSPVRKPHAL